MSRCPEASSSLFDSHVTRASQGLMQLEWLWWIDEMGASGARRMNVR